MRLDRKKFFDGIDQLVKSSHSVVIDGMTSTRIDYIAEGEQTTLTLIGYSISTDSLVAELFDV